MATQAWSRKRELDRDVLEHVRAMLLALAALVVRSAALPTFERLHFLSVMGHGEAEVRRLLLAMASGLDGPTGSNAASTDAAVTPVHGVGDASLLAARFRMLALAVDAMLALAGAESPRQSASPSISREPRRASQYTPSPAPRATSPPVRERSRGVGDDDLSANGAHAHRSPLAFDFSHPVARRCFMLRSPMCRTCPTMRLLGLCIWALLHPPKATP